MKGPDIIVLIKILTTENDRTKQDLADLLLQEVVENLIMFSVSERVRELRSLNPDKERICALTALRDQALRLDLDPAPRDNRQSLEEALKIYGALQKCGAQTFLIQPFKI